jgi:flagellar basal-body rod protein FlgB
MFEPLEVTRMAHALAAHASARQQAIATNVAHADTPGYRARDVEDFATLYRRMTTENAGNAATPRTVEVAPGVALSPNDNSVSLETEMMKAVETRHQFDMALSVYQSVSGIIRASLGR